MQASVAVIGATPLPAAWDTRMPAARSRRVSVVAAARAGSLSQVWLSVRAERGAQYALMLGRQFGTRRTASK